MRLVLAATLCCLMPLTLTAQTTVDAEPESLFKIPIGPGKNEAVFGLSSDGFTSPNGPMVTPQGELLLVPTYQEASFLKYSRERLEQVAAHSGWPDYPGPGIWRVSSQQGLVKGLLSNTIYRFRGTVVDILDRGDTPLPPSLYDMVYPIPGGAVVETRDSKFLYSMQILQGSNFRVRDREETKAWLPSQPGGFSIGDDGHLYRNGVLWSATRRLGTYSGKLMSGHNIWTGGGMLGFTRFVDITNPQGQIELTITNPWAPVDNSRDATFNPFDTGIGPWGEIYYLIAPEWDQQDNYNPPVGSTAELVVVRNHLKYFGRLNADGVRLRKEPSTTADILATYPAKTGFRILGQGGKTETINGKTSDWTQVRMLDGKEGWVFGAFVHNLYDGPNGSPPPWPNVPDW